jgi:hypothetical protein
VLQVKRLASGCLPKSLAFSAEAVQLGFVVDKVTLDRILYEQFSLRFSLSFTQCWIFIFIYLLPPTIQIVTVPTADKHSRKNCAHVTFNTLQLGCYCMYRQVLRYKIVRSAHTVYLCVLCGSENKQRLFLYTALTDWFLNRD